MLDIWRVRNPDTKRFTWRRLNPITQSRLDFWLISAELSSNIIKCEIKPSIKTDHSLIALKIRINKKTSSGRGLWKFNSNLLADIDFTGYMRGFIIMQIKNLANIEDCSLKWELIKMEIRNATISYSKTQAQLRKEYENQLSARYQTLHDLLEDKYTDELLAEFIYVKMEIEKINAIKTEGARIRSKAIFVEQNEKSSRLFLNLEKRSASLKNITCIKLEDKTEISEANAILNELSSFYQKLYGTNMYDETFEKYFLHNPIPTISDNHKDHCDSIFTIDECSKALATMKTNKSPGTDGLTTEFYTCFWNEIQHLVFESIQGAFNKEVLSCEQKRGVLRLLPKKGKDLSYVKNWRPISLLNTDYKLLTHILAKRLHTALPSVIAKDQSGYLQGRNIGINIRTITDIIESAEKHKDSSLLAFLDFEKAFDKLNWTFLQKTLQLFGFGPYLRKWVKIIYTDIESCIINNGTTSNYFKLKSGIRQGCPLSALLFILCVEILAIEFRHNCKIQGFKIGNEEFKLTQLADDTTLFLKNIDSLREVLKVTKHFEKLSGLKLNDTKTEIFQVGPPLTSNYTLLNLKWEKEKIYALGSWFYKDSQSSITHTFQSKLQMIAKIINIWSHRNLTWIGKIVIIKSLCISKINYAISTLETPDWFLKQVKELIEKFLWNGKPARVKNSVMQNDVEFGGLRMTNLFCYNKAQKINWIKIFLLNKETMPFKFLSTFINIKFEHYLKCNVDPLAISQNMPNFYKEVLSAWFSLKKKPFLVNEIQREVLWYNKYITINKKSIFKKKMYENGVVFLNDILDDANKLLNYAAFTMKFGNCISEYDYMCLRDAIPHEWRNTLTTNTHLQLIPDLEMVHITLGENNLKPVLFTKSKHIYWLLYNQNITTPTCKQSWFEKHFVAFNDKTWKNIYTLAKYLTQDTKLVEFQFKIIHRVYATDSYVAKFDETVNETCIKCDQINNIPHFFVDCIKVQQFWLDFKGWINNIEGKIIDLKTIDIIFGIIQTCTFRINFLLLHAKWWIHVNREQKQNILFLPFLSYIKKIMYIEKQIALGRQSLTLYNLRFNVIDNLFENEL